jgi:hypothetical protein
MSLYKILCIIFDDKNPKYIYSMCEESITMQISWEINKNGFCTSPEENKIQIHIFLGEMDFGNIYWDLCNEKLTWLTNINRLLLSNIALFQKEI